MRFIPLLILAVAGCAGRLVPPGIVGNEVGVTITNVWAPADALRYADSYCHQYGKVARLNQAHGYGATFDCVKA